jgi:TatD DNase family protein
VELIDTHAHLDFDAFDKDRSVMIDRAWGAGLVNIITIGSGNGTQSADNAISLAEGDEKIFATVGVHPHDADLGIKWKGDPKGPVDPEVWRAWEEEKQQVLERFARLAGHPRVLAVGEVGLDFHYDNSPRQMQRDLFRSFIKLALDKKKPLVIHSREAEEETAQILKEEHAGDAGGVVHCFSGRPQLMEAALDLDFYFGIVGVVTFKKARELHQAVKDLPAERLVVETDCPYLAPVPYRGKRNEPAYVAETVRELARLRGQEPEEIARITTENARRLFAGQLGDLQ